MTDHRDELDPHAPFEDTDDVDGLDLTPREVAPARSASADRGRRVAILGALGVLVVALVFMAYQGLNNATVFFRNVDEAVAERDSIGDRRFRLQGRVVDGSLESDGTSVTFTVEHAGVQAAVRHVGDPPELFQASIPVVLEGTWSDEGEWFESDRILVKHEEEYEAENPERTDEFVGEGADLG
jgi:cytochrome c-type biogenesis protein CcmE